MSGVPGVNEPMADEKWITGIGGDTPLREAAARVLAVRLGAVGARLPPALARADDDAEHVHQLRVATRRAGAALRIFRECLPDRLFRRARRTLRRVRRAAGGARDWDVFLEMLRARLPRAPAGQRRGLDFLLGFGHGQRAAAQAHLDEALAGQEERVRELGAECAETLATGDEGRTLRDVAVPTLAELLGELERAGGAAGSYDALHRVRILGKQLRYAMEVFESCFADDFRERLYPRVVLMQDVLGKANDSHVALGRLGALQARLEKTEPAEWQACRPAFMALLRYHRRRLGEQRRLFARWWAEWQASGAAASFERVVQAD